MSGSGSAPAEAESAERGAERRDDGHLGACAGQREADAVRDRVPLHTAYRGVQRSGSHRAVWLLQRQRLQTADGATRREGRGGEADGFIGRHPEEKNGLEAGGQVSLEEARLKQCAVFCLCALFFLL